MPSEDDFAALYRARMIDPADPPPTRKLINLRALILHYKGHLRAHPFHELFAVLGVAAGVALLFAVQVANKSVTGSFDELSEGIAGRATLEIAARSPQGFSQEIYRKVGRLKSVEASAPVLEQQIAARGPLGRRPLTLVGVDERLGTLGGSLVTRASQRGRNLTKLGLQFTEPTARSIGVGVGDKVKVELGARLKRFPVAGVLSERAIGSLAQSPIAMAPLGLVQEMTDMPGRVTRVLVAPQAGQKAKAKSQLKRLAGDRLNVRSSHSEARLLDEAATSDRQSTALFSAISLVVGILLVFNAMLLSLSDRRRFVSILRSWGFPTATIIGSLAFDACVVGVVGSLAGLAVGDQLSRHLLDQVPAFLSFAFPIGTQRVVELQTVAISFLAGIAAVLAAVIKPAIEIVKTAPRERFLQYDFSLTDPGARINRRRLFWLGVTLIVVSILLALADANTALVTAGGQVVGLVMILPQAVSSLIVAGQRAARRGHSAILRISLGELAITPTRATALAATGALAVFAIVAIGGVAKDLARGGENTVADIYSNANLFITPGADESFYRTVAFDDASAIERLNKLHEVSSTRVYRGGFLDLPSRRILVMAPSRSEPKLLAHSQLVEGDRSLAQERLRLKGWAALSSALANERGLTIGERFSLPTPTGVRRMRLAAIINNHGWFPGALLINADDYQRLWGTRRAGILEVALKRGAALGAGKARVQRALGPNSALNVQTAAERSRLSANVIRQGLSRLHQISIIVIIAVVLAVAAAMLGSVWQRRERLGSLVSMGVTARTIYGAVFLEAAVILMLGCTFGAGLGLVSQMLGGRWLELTTDSPVPFDPAWALIARTLAAIIALATASIVIALRFTLPLRPKIALQSD